MTFVVKHRGAPATPFTFADYECPAHGRFEREVERDANGDPPATVECGHPRDTIWGRVYCTNIAEYCISAPLVRVRKVEAVRGKWERPERPTFTDTRNLGEGQSLADWKADRAKVWEEKRKQDVIRFARENNENLIGKDV